MKNPKPTSPNKPPRLYPKIQTPPLVLAAIFVDDIFNDTFNQLDSLNAKLDSLETMMEEEGEEKE